MSTFADSSALVKLYADEQDGSLVRSISDLIVSRLARVEVPSAFWRKQRTGELSAAQTMALIAGFEADYHGTASEMPRFAVIPPTPDLLVDAARLCGVHQLRAYDAVQLASARAAAAVDDDCTSFAAFDQALRDAAATEGFALVPRP